MIRIKVPATSANLGVGFDCMGLAVSLYSTVDFDFSEGHLEIIGCPDEYKNRNNLIYQAFVYECEYLDKPIPNLKITINNNIPMSRGLGSSAFCIVAGLMGANSWYDSPLSKEELLDLATQLEGHPDNVSPAIFGKLGVSFIDEQGDVQTVHFEVAKDLHFVAMIPNYEVSTEQARKILPQEMSYSEAIYQIGHAVALSKAFENGDLNLIKKAIVDKMHEPYRSKLIPDYDQAKQICLANHGVMYISGSGSTLMAITDNQDDADEIIAEIKKSFPNWKTHHLNVDIEGALEI